MKQSNPMSEGLAEKSVFPYLVGPCRHRKSALTLPLALIVSIGCSSGSGSVGEQTDSVRQSVSSPSVSDAGQAAQTVAIGQPTLQEEQSLKDWGKAMVKTPVPKKGCFEAVHPNSSWQEVPCDTSMPPVAGPPPYGSPRALDYVNTGVNDPGVTAQVSGTTIVTANAWFPSVTDVTSESDSYGNNSFSIQVNTNVFNTPACAQYNTPNPASCQGWEQFVYGNPYLAGGTTGGLVIQDYMVYYFNSSCLPPSCNCPGGWTYDNGFGCYQLNGYASTGAAKTISALLDLELQTGITTNGNGTTDWVAMYVGGGYAVASAQDSILSLANNWNAVEFNIYGNGGSQTATFNSGATIVAEVDLGYANGGHSSPTCTVGLPNTGEKNNLTVVSGSCCATSGPSITFTESSASPAPMAPWCLLNDITPIESPALL